MVLTASMSGFVVNAPQPHPAYAVSKAAVHHLARSLAGEWVGHGIRVNSISPGIMNTRLSGGPAQKDLRKLWLEKSPMGIGDPEDLTGAVVLLCSEAGKFITGTDIKLDGTWTKGYGQRFKLTMDRRLHRILKSTAWRNKTGQPGLFPTLSASLKRVPNFTRRRIPVSIKPGSNHRHMPFQG